MKPAVSELTNGAFLKELIERLIALEVLSASQIDDLLSIHEGKHECMSHWPILGVEEIGSKLGEAFSTSRLHGIFIALSSSFSRNCDAGYFFAQAAIVSNQNREHTEVAEELVSAVPENYRPYLNKYFAETT